MNKLEALQIAIEELEVNAEHLRVTNKGYESRVEVECNHLLAARNVLINLLTELEKAES